MTKRIELPDHHDLAEEALDYYGSDPTQAVLNQAQAYERALLDYETLRHEVAIQSSRLLETTIELSFVGPHGVS
ncbi:MAG TPA: hypothetical protein VK712_02690 [Verrucomicrobiae bacterium]|jgi:hypothetical protein|nr:hypothetical protein [Verrucomicrobiae bacterium]